MNPPTPPTQAQFAAEISAQLAQHAITTLVNELAATRLKLDELTRAAQSATASASPDPQ